MRLPASPVCWLPMGRADLPRVLAIENRCYTHPWTPGHFEDSLRAGYQARLLLEAEQLLGYFVAMKGVDEVHLLNLTVAPERQRQGWARVLLDALAQSAREQGAHSLWLEVRASNVRAQAVYQRHGFRQVGLRRHYYPLNQSQREDAMVMSQSL